MGFYFENKKYNQQLDKSLFFKLSETEKELHSRLKQLMPIEEIVIEIGSVFSNSDYKNLTKNEMEKIIYNAKSKTVEWERKINAVDDFLTALKKSNANPKMILKIFFENPREKVISTDPLFNLLDTEEGHSFIKHLYECKNTICNCVEAKQKLNKMIKVVKEQKVVLENEYKLYDNLTKENFQTVSNYINKIMDVYWITNLIYDLQKEKAQIKKMKNREK